MKWEARVEFFKVGFDMNLDFPEELQYQHEFTNAFQIPKVIIAGMTGLSFNFTPFIHS